MAKKGETFADRAADLILKIGAAIAGCLTILLLLLINFWPVALVLLIFAACIKFLLS